ncbi:MAG: 2-amino-4-hydroxy-6-hydroxymethyldihydropteridine diphosphokinase [Thermoanaerobaculum sp.]|nr:2-amino-4-hydroxy-6-hydroxymethyldihydropteridine diphosphokinase [Thermoanaerobaculum sp.]
MTPVLLLLGSNIKPHLHIPAAKKELQELLAHCRFSRTYLTEPVGDSHQPPFWNLAACGYTALSLADLQRELAQLEQRHGRLRDPDRPCGPRTLDVDLLLYGQTVGRFGSLELPAPLLAKEAFVLIPAAEVAPHWCHPVLGKSLASLAREIGSTGVQLLPEEANA